ncbi:cilia- and flagella-associated protein 45 [Anoplophora glabripennis]|uniref:cilia- and flagella-associated protein 45 n=1 Tax=Anoplophora glabripennis TaxID=217634 RepID=UPI00087502FF|nr:cilia- and flagella-associated protein 45 [Anoplophora glabripennis]
MATTGKFHSQAKPVKVTGDHSIDECNHRLHGQYIHYKPLKATEGKEKVKTFEGHGTRELIVPSRVPLDVPGILPNSEFQRLKKQAHVVTVQDRMTMLEEAERQKNKLAMESALRKENLLKAQKPQMAVPGSKLETVETEVASKNLYLLKRSQELIIEQDDRVKAANGVILAAKCRAIRNAQIAEKKLIEKQLQEENKRLDMMMEQQRQKKILVEEQKRELDKKKMERYTVEIKQQIKENELNRLMEAEIIEEESKMLNKALIQMQKEEQQKELAKKELQAQMREEFKKANIDVENYKLLKQEEQRIADMRKEKEWREKEKAAALKQKKLTADLKESRARQIEDIRKQQAVALARDEEDFMKVAKVQRMLFEKDMVEREKKKELKLKHKKELLKQINEKEKERIMHQQGIFEDGKAQRLEYEINDRKVEDYLKDKVERLRENNVPDQYIKDIERQLKIKK